MGCQRMFTDRGIFMFKNTLMKVSNLIADIISITQITCKGVHNALLIFHIFHFFDVIMTLA